MVLLRGDIHSRSLCFDYLYEKLAGNGMVFSDDSIIALIERHNIENICIDSPLTLPPCVACQREVCPGVDLCEDLSLSYMQSIVNLADHKKTRKNPFNPQTQRLWDVKEYIEQGGHIDPSFSANQTPIVIRAQVLQKRLNSLERAPYLYETSIKLLMSALGKLDKHLAGIRYNYLHSKEGIPVRKQIIMILQNFFETDLLKDEHLYEKVEIFCAFVSAFVSVCIEEGFCEPPSNPYFADHGWVWLIDFEALTAVGS